MWNKISTKTKLISLLIVLITASLLYKWYSPSTSQEPTMVTEAPTAKAVDSIPKKEVPMKKLVVYDKKQVAKKVNLPDSVVDDLDEEVTSVSDVAASKAGVTVTTVVDKETGITKVYQEPKKLPLFGLGGEARVGVGYSVGTGGPEVNVHGQYDFFRAGNFYGHVRGEVYQKSKGGTTEARGTVGVDYVW